MKREPLYVDIGMRIAAARKKRGVTQATLGQELRERGVIKNRTSVTHMELGLCRAMPHVLFAIAEVLDVPVSELMPTSVDDRMRNYTVVVSCDLEIIKTVEVTAASEEEARQIAEATVLALVEKLRPKGIVKSSSSRIMIKEVS